MTRLAPCFAAVLAIAVVAFTPLHVEAEDAAPADQAEAHEVTAEQTTERSAEMIHRLASPGAGENAEAQYVLVDMAIQGHAPSQYVLGVMYREGAGMFRDRALSVKWLRRAAEQGHADARSQLEFIALEGDAAAHRALGAIYRDGAGIAEDQNAALAHFRSAAALGDVQALVELGEFYRSGVVVGLDDARATELFREAAEGAMAAVHHAHADAPPGSFASETEAWMSVAVARTLDERTSWGAADIARAEAFALYWTGLMDLIGAGVPVDAAKAVARHCLAAAQGSDLAEYNLGMLYLRGHGVPRDLALAHHWFARAASHGHELAAERRDQIAPPEGIARHDGVAQSACDVTAATG